MSRARPPLLLALLLLCGGACNHSRGLERNIDKVQHSLEQVLSSGGYTCAPRELALARAHLGFARDELAHGDPKRADQELEEAALNARAAASLSPAERCAGQGPIVRDIPHTEEPDRDHDGLSDAMDVCPDAAEDLDGFQDADGCPDPDNDQDGVPDTIDRCPNQSEGNARGYQHGDGCPRPDADSDGVPDAVDRCPTQPGAAANEGCPRLRYRGLEVLQQSLRLSEPVIFEEDTAVIRSVSFPVLDMVAQALLDHPEIKLEIQGHTDSQGDAQHNMNLSQQRADAVLAYLVQHGIDPARLTAQGYGETRPMESNRTSQGRDINRRIELVRTDAAQ
jgi:outer membrane protein OmpA-like peptidoglycan-associated protein